MSTHADSITAQRAALAHCTEGGRAVHASYLVEKDGKVFIHGTDCNREVFTINNKRRYFARTDAPVTCKRCIRINGK